jgi:hypothetical protein
MNSLFYQDDKEKDRFFFLFLKNLSFLNIEIETIFKATIDIESEIADVAKPGRLRLVVGWSREIYSDHSW